MTVWNGLHSGAYSASIPYGDDLVPRVGDVGVGDDPYACFVWADASEAQGCGNVHVGWEAIHRVCGGAFVEGYGFVGGETRVGSL